MAADDDAWLDALAGRAPGGTAPDAERLRQALLPLPEPATQARWHDVVAAAGGFTAGQPVLPDAQPLQLLRDAPTAANQARYKAPLAWAAAVVLAMALGLWWTAPPEPAALRGAPATAGARWLVVDPANSSQALATDLRQAGASVRVEAAGATWVLHIEADTAARAAVNARLQALETGLDAQGRLVLRVHNAP